MKITKVQKQIPTIRISRNMLTDICTILEKEKSNENDEVLYEFNNFDVSISENDQKAFVNNVPNTIGKIELSLDAKVGSIVVNIKSSTYYDWNHFLVTGEDPTWVFGVAKQLEEAFQRYRTRNEIFYTQKGYVIYGACIVALFFTIFFPLTLADIRFEGSDSSLSFATVIAGVISPQSAWLWSTIFKRAYPILEIENSSKIKFRGVLIALFVGIASSIIASLLIRALIP